MKIWKISDSSQGIILELISKKSLESGSQNNALVSLWGSGTATCSLQTTFNCFDVLSSIYPISSKCPTVLGFMQNTVVIPHPDFCQFPKETFEVSHPDPDCAPLSYTAPSLFISIILQVRAGPELHVSWSYICLIYFIIACLPDWRSNEGQESQGYKRIHFSNSLWPGDQFTSD